MKRVIVENAFMTFVHEIIGLKISFSAANIVRLCNRGYLTRPDVRSKDATKSYVIMFSNNKEWSRVRR